MRLPRNPRPTSDSDRRLAPARATRGWLVLLTLFSPFALADTSICYGTTANGRLENGVRLPMRGDNFQSYSVAASLAGRTHVHAQIRDVIVASYQALRHSAPDRIYVYAETGWAAGGPFEPHRTHQNGLSVDFMVPVLSGGRSVPLPTGPLNRLGYDIEFDRDGRFKDYRIDYPAMARHLVELHRAATSRGVGIRRVIFDPQMQPALFDTADGPYLRQHLQFSRKPAWVRHDEHYHVDFEITCEPM